MAKDSQLSRLKVRPDETGTTAELHESSDGANLLELYNRAGTILRAHFDSIGRLSISEAPTLATHVMRKSDAQPLAAGNTLSRPAAPATGEMFFDTQIGIPVWWNGSAWVDATGVGA